MKFFDDEKKILDLKKICTYFEGTHYFHNYTAPWRYKSKASLQRFIQLFDVKIGNFNDVDHLEFTIQGNSFLYHQIRKMVGYSLKTFFENFSEEKILESFDFQTHLSDVPLAPSEGLYLSEMKFFNEEIKISERGLKEKNQFENDVLLNEIFSHERKFGEWLDELIEG